MQPETAAAQIFEESLPSSILHPVSVADLLTLELPERKRLLPWLPEGGLVMVVGQRGIGKTYFTLSMAIALASGQSFLKWDVAVPTGVLPVDGEMSLSDLRDRIGTLLPEELSAPLEIASHELIYARTERDINLGIAEWQEAIHAYLDERPDIGVVILDNLSCLLPTVAEDKRDEWSTKVSPFLIRLRRRGVAVIMVHHTGKGGVQRGTSSREDALDTEILLTRPPNYDEILGAQFIVQFVKARGCFGDDVAQVEASLLSDADDLPQWSWKPIELSNEDRLLALVYDGIDSVKDAAVELDLTPGAISKIKKRLQKKGKLAPGTALVLADY